MGDLKGLYAKSELLQEQLEGKADPKLEESLGLKEKIDSKDDSQSSENDVKQPVETKVKQVPFYRGSILAKTTFQLFTVYIKVSLCLNLLLYFLLIIFKKIVCVFPGPRQSLPSALSLRCA